MATPIATCGRRSEQARAAEALVAALEDALLATRSLLATLDTAAVCAASPGNSDVVGVASLSRREVEVLRLLAAGHSNRRIAQALYLSPRTVQRHVANVYLKIGAHCRSEATAYALRHRLA